MIVPSSSILLLCWIGLLLLLLLQTAGITNAFVVVTTTPTTKQKPIATSSITTFGGRQNNGIMSTSNTKTNSRHNLIITGRPLFATTKGPRPLHTEFTVQKATSELLDELNVLNWPTWSTDDSSKYKVGIKSPLKVYDCNELSYITDGVVDIIHAPTGIVNTVQKGDFVTFPDGYECYWYVKETIVKHWYIY